MFHSQNELIKLLVDNFDAFQNDADRRSLPIDYFNWGRDSRHVLDNTEMLPTLPKAKSKLKRVIKDIILGFQKFTFPRAFYISQLNKYHDFESAYHSISDTQSKNLFSELLSMQVLGEKNYRLTSFTDEHVAAYERASDAALRSKETLSVYNWELRRVAVNSEGLKLFTGPDLMCLVDLGRLYRYRSSDVTIEMESGDVVIDCGVGWGDTTAFFASAVGASGEVHCFELNDEGLNALERQLAVSEVSATIKPNKLAVSDIDDHTLYVGEASPSTRITGNLNKGAPVLTITLDTYCNRNDVSKVDFIKMDIEGAEIMALNGARQILRRDKPKLAISVYHKWDDLREIPRLIKSIRPDYEFYLDCTTGFGGEAVLYCR
jgi:FkbM family methyltransferase